MRILKIELDETEKDALAYLLDQGDALVNAGLCSAVQAYELRGWAEHEHFGALKLDHGADHRLLRALHAVASGIDDDCPLVLSDAQRDALWSICEGTHACLGNELEKGL